jgi:hypothetical protein
MRINGDIRKHLIMMISLLRKLGTGRNRGPSRAMHTANRRGADFITKYG